MDIDLGDERFFTMDNIIGPHQPEPRQDPPHVEGVAPLGPYFATFAGPMGLYHVEEKPGKRSGHWDAVRDAFLKTHPTCSGCGATEYIQVHHIKPFHLFPEHELSYDNLIGLCEGPGHSCHYYFGHCRNWHAYNPHVREDAALFLKRVQNRKMDKPKE